MWCYVITYQNKGVVFLPQLWYLCYNCIKLQYKIMWYFRNICGLFATILSTDYPQKIENYTHGSGASCGARGGVFG